MKEIEAPAQGESRRQQLLPRSKAERASPRLYKGLNACELIILAVLVPLPESPLGPLLAAPMLLMSPV